MQRGRQRQRRPLQSTRARRLLSRAATAAAGDDGGRTHARGCTMLLSRRRTGHGPGAVAPGAATPPTNGPQTESAPNASDRSRRCAAPPPCHCLDDDRGARRAPPRPFSTVSQVAQPHRTPQKQAAALDCPLARGESGGRLSCLSRSGALQATPSVARVARRPRSNATELPARHVAPSRPFTVDGQSRVWPGRCTARVRLTNEHADR